MVTHSFLVGIPTCYFPDAWAHNVPERVLISVLAAGWTNRPGGRAASTVRRLGHSSFIYPCNGTLLELEICLMLGLCLNYSCSTLIIEQNGEMFSLGEASRSHHVYSGDVPDSGFKN